MRTRPELFDGLRSIHLHNFMQLCLRQGRISDDHCSLDELGLLAPSVVTQRLVDILTYQRRIFTEEVQLSKPEAEGLPRSTAEQYHALDADWFEWRLARGLVTRLDNDFLKAIWQSLAHATVLEFGDRDSDDSTLDCELVRSSMTSGEESFAQLIDRLTQQLHPAYYKTAVVEALSAFTRYCETHPHAYFAEPVVFSQILEAAAKQFVEKHDHAKPGTRAIDNLLEQSPGILQDHVAQVLEALDRATETA